MIRVSFFENLAWRLMVMRFGLALVLLIVASALPVEEVRGQSPRSLEQRFQDLCDEARAFEVGNEEPSQPFHRFAPRFLELAVSSPADPAARKSLLWIIQAGFPLLDAFRYGESEPPLRVMGQTFDLLGKSHSQDDEVGMACLLLYRLPSPPRERFLRTLVNQSENRVVKGLACYSLAKLLVTKAGIARNIQNPPANRSKMAPPDETLWGADYADELRKSETDKLLAEADTLLERIIAEFTDVRYSLATPMTQSARVYLGRNPGLGKTLGELAKVDLDDIHNLSVGKVAPEIEGRDAEGKPFKLSDSRGKVVLLTFSGNWCNPCRAMYPLERALVERLKGQPFALLSVNTDESLDTLHKSIDSGEITWKCWWDGPDRPICSRWNIRSFPTMYLIDREGVIRQRGVNHLGLDQAVDALIAEPVRAAK
jgi:thiol-disulfide isomerase/thioredoxin